VAIAIVGRFQVAQGDSDPQKFAEGVSEQPWGLLAVAMPGRRLVDFVMAWVGVGPWRSSLQKNLREFGRGTIDFPGLA